MAHALQDRGEAEIRAIVHDAGIPEGIGAVSVLNHFYGRDDILLGAYKGNFGKDPNNNGWVRGAYVDDLVNNWDSPIRDSSQVMEATEVYRKVLSEAEDNSIVISSIGKMFNTLRRHLAVKLIFPYTQLCLKITQNVAFKFLNFGIFHQFLSY